MKIVDESCWSLAMAVSAGHGRFALFRQPLLGRIPFGRPFLVSHHSSNYHGRSYASGSSFHGYHASGSHHDATRTVMLLSVSSGIPTGGSSVPRKRRKQFMRQSGHPHGWPGHVVDHIIPLKRGGADSPSNMQWQTIEEAKAKDKWE